MTDFITYHVIGGVTDKNSPYGPGVHYYETLSAYAAAKKKEQHDPRTLKEIMLEIAQDNHLKDPFDKKDCTEKTVSVVTLKINQELLIRGTKIHPTLHFDCPPLRAQEHPAEAAPVAGAAPRGITGIPQAEVIVEPEGTKQDAVNLDGVMYFVGRKPKDVAAEKEGLADLAKKNLSPNTQEGKHVDTASTSNTANAARADLNMLNLPGNLVAGTGDIISTQRAKNGAELEFEPGQHYIVDSQGKAVRPNPRLNQKLEDDIRLEKDTEGKTRAVLDASAEVSLNRRLNPDYAGIFGILGIREASTASNQIEKLGNTGPGMSLVLTYTGYERLNQKISKPYFESATPSAADAEKLLQLDVQAALHPLVWSVDSYGVPVKTPQVLHAEMQRVIDHLPEGADKAHLTSTYITPYSNLLSNPAKLNETIKLHGGREQWVNPMTDWAWERQNNEYIHDQYANVPYPDDLHDDASITRFQNESSVNAGLAYANKMWRDSVRPPTKTEIKLGMGQLNNPVAQQEDHLAPARVDVLQALVNDPNARAAWINHQLATEDGLQNVTDLLHFSSNAAMANHSILAYQNGAEGAAGAKAIATRLAGEEQAKGLMHTDPNIPTGFFNGLFHTVTAGWWTNDKNDNQNNGLFGFQEATQQRWNDPATHAEVDAAFTEVLQRSIAAQKMGLVASPIASTALALTMDEQRANKKPETTATYDALINALPKNQQDTPLNQMTANLDNAGHRFVTTAIAQQIKAGVMAGDNIATVDDKTANAARAAGGASIALTAAQAAQLGAVPADTEAKLTTFRTDTARAARGQDTATQAAVMANSDDPKVSQNQLNAHMMNLMAKGSPADFAAMMVGAIKAADASGDQVLATSLRSHVTQLSDTNLIDDNALAALITKEVAANHNAATTKATFTKYFAGKNSDAKVHALEATALARSLGSDVTAGSAMVDSIRAGAASQQREVLAGLSATAQTALLNISSVPDQAYQAQALEAFSQQYGDQINTLNATHGFSLVALAELGLFAYSLTGGVPKHHTPPPTKPTPTQVVTPPPTPTPTQIPIGPIPTTPTPFCNHCVVPVTPPPVVVTPPPVVVTPPPVVVTPPPVVVTPPPTQLPPVPTVGIPTGGIPTTPLPSCASPECLPGSTTISTVTPTVSTTTGIPLTGVIPTAPLAPGGAIGVPSIGTPLPAVPTLPVGVNASLVNPKNFQVAGLGHVPETASGTVIPTLPPGMNMNVAEKASKTV